MTIISLLTDFGTEDPFVGIMKGVILGIAPDVQIVDLTHSVPPQDVRLGALMLSSAVEYFAPGTIHVAVVDPGVGSQRRAIVIETPKALLIGPDNGLLFPAARKLGISSIRSLENPALFCQPLSRTFHGRDVFAPVAAHLARGVALQNVGSAFTHCESLDLPEPRRSDTSIEGEVLYVDGFGNLITNIPGALLSNFPALDLSVSIVGMQIVGLSNSYSAVAAGAPLAIVSSSDLLEIAVRDGNAGQQLGAGVGVAVTVSVPRR
ncbi:MAG TPA: SAM-dependent chlorinase/fluorinase [Candidatus Acidoferrales bacterium]|nr:SAM-dependent chlorinase/fluorinase [Candidatus Acidoferrales bacterium]